MIGLDTNVLLRYLLGDDPVQSPKAAHFLERVLSQQNPGFVSLVTLSEVVWVLGSVYRFTHLEIVSAIQGVLQTETFLVQNQPEVYTAMIALQSGQADFADALIAALGDWANCSTTITFDKKAARLPGFQLL